VHASAGALDVTDPGPAMAPAPPSTEWQSRAACRNVDRSLFYPRPGQSGRAAKRICAACPVREQCLESVLATQTSYAEDHGIFAGTSRRDRLPMRMARRAAAAATSPTGAQVVPIGRARRSRPPVTRVYQDRGAAAEAFRLAEQQGVNEAARRLGVGTGSLYRAWNRWGLGVPDTSASAARWERQLHTGSRHRGLAHGRRDRPAAARPPGHVLVAEPPAPSRAGLAGQRARPQSHPILRILRRGTRADLQAVSDVRVA
jgi:WhiB family transcriptional regulator, redox-sensing transcriptional regulator